MDFFSRLLFFKRGRSQRDEAVPLALGQCGLTQDLSSK